MKKIKIDVVAVPLSGHLYPTLNLVKPLLDDPSMEIRVFTGPQKKAVAESFGFTVVPILEDKVEEFERAANNDKKLNLFSAYRQLSKSLDLINHVSDQLLEEWRVNRPDIVIADFITLSAGFVAEEACPALRQRIPEYLQFHVQCAPFPVRFQIGRAHV